MADVLLPCQISLKEYYRNTLQLLTAIDIAAKTFNFDSEEPMSTSEFRTVSFYIAGFELQNRDWRDIILNSNNSKIYLNRFLAVNDPLVKLCLFF